MNTHGSSAELTLRKVATFITRGDGAARELLVFRHSNGSLQIPAGTVHEQEMPLDAAMREAGEESGLSEFTFAADLGVRRVDVEDDNAYLLADALLQLTPDRDSTIVHGVTLRRGQRVRVTARQAGYAKVSVEEGEQRETGFVITARKSGWISAHSLTQQVERHYFHFKTTEATAAEWKVQAEPDQIFTCFWLPMQPGIALASPQDEWLHTYYRQISR
ncbi:MAG: NUDIX domain-containing protein [Chloroflexota bacterium]|nr:NUDIX domain-containing protein [Chloroflexota bacterium]